MASPRCTAAPARWWRSPALSWLYSLDGAATWTDTGAQVVLDGTANQTLYGGWQTIPAGLRPRINVTAALFGQGGNGSTQVEMTGFSFDIRGVDQTSAARLLSTRITPAEIADPIATELRSFSPKDRTVISSARSRTRF